MNEIRRKGKVAERRSKGGEGKGERRTENKIREGKMRGVRERRKWGEK